MDLRQLYHDYIACLNARDWSNLSRFVALDVTHNDVPLGIDGYQKMLERDFEDIPDLRFNVDLMVAEPPHVAAILRFDCSPKGKFLHLNVDGRRLTFCENVFYQFRDEKIVRVRSVIDKVAIEAQL